MKNVISIVVLIAGAHVAIYFASCYVMGGIEAGLPGGGNKVYGEYHDDNLVTDWLSGGESKARSTSSESPRSRGVAANPFVDEQTQPPE